MTDARVRMRFIEIAIVLISIAMLMFQILQTITMSLQALEKNAFLVISLCLMGLGGGGAIATLMGKRQQESPQKVLWWAALGFGVTMVISMFFSSRTLSLSGLILLGVAPYVFVGIFLSFIFRSWARQANRLYFLNLVGSGAGCLALIWVMKLTGDVPLALFFVSALTLGAAACIALAYSNRGFIVPIAIVVVLIALAPFREGLFPFRPAKLKGMGLIMDNPRITSDVTWSKWGYLGRLDIVQPGEGIEHFRLGGQSVARLLDDGCDVQFLFASGGNWTKAIDFKGKENVRRRFVRTTRHSLAYILAPKPKVLNIGFGGGIDIFLALQHDAESVVGVDINPLMIEGGRDHLAGYFEDFYNDPRVSIVMMDGRAYVRGTDKKFNVVSLTAVDTGELLHQNAHVLLENYLYTQEAFDDYLSILEDDGFLYVSRPFTQITRAIATGIASLRRIGIDDPEKHFAVLGRGEIGRGRWRSVLVSKKPLTPKQIARIDRQYAQHVGYLPGQTGHDKDFEALFGAVKRDDEEAYLASLNNDYTPVYDDRPFFYDFSRTMSGSPAVSLLTRVFIWVMSIAAVLILVPMIAVGVRGNLMGGKLFGVMGYFSAIGAGFMFIEIFLIQKLVLFLGHPSYSVTVTLFSILIFSGLGSMFARRFDVSSPRTAGMIWLPILLGVLFYALLLGPILSLVPNSIVVRIIAATILLAPVSFFMGMPFPTMIRQLGAGDDVLIPWAWAINAFTSVATSVLSVLFATQVGFSVVLYLGGLFYVAALFFFLMRIRQPTAAESG